MKKFAVRLCVSLCVATFSFTAFSETASELWGRQGEHWSHDSRLPDFSFAGYGYGEREIPQVDVVANVVDYGADGSDEADDSQAFLKAIEEAENGAILVPNGKYIITEILEITKPNLVLRGESKDGAVLYFPTPLQEIRPNWGATTTGDKTSNYSWSGGFVWIRGDWRNQTLAEISAPAERGGFEIEVDDVSSLEVGQWITVYQRDNDDNSLAYHLYSGDPGDTGNLKGRTRAELTARIEDISGKHLTLNRALRFDIELRWNPVVQAFNPSVMESGVENLTFEFPVTPYQGHFTEMGFNPIAINNAAHCWARNLLFKHVDSGLFISGWFCTIKDITFISERETERSRKATGHHGCTLSGNDNLFTGFDIQTRFMHDMTATHGAGNVFSNGRGVDICFDHHKRAPYENLFTNIDMGLGTRPWQCGGGAALGKNCGARGTFWNLRSERPMQYPPDRFGPWSMNLVAVNTDQEAVTDMDGKWFEVIPNNEIVPQNLHEAQLERRLAKKN